MEWKYTTSIVLLLVIPQKQRIKPINNIKLAILYSTQEGGLSSFENRN